MARKSKLQKPARPLRERRLRGVWGAIALLSAGAAIVSAASDTGRQRVAELFGPGEPNLADGYAKQSEIAALSAELTRLRSETRLLALEKEAMSIKITALESEFGPITGSIPNTADQSEHESAATAANAKPDEVTPKAVRTIDVGFVPLPVDRKVPPIPQAAGQQPQTELASPNAQHGGLEDQASSTARSLSASITQTRFSIQLTVEDSMNAARERWKELSQKHDPLLGPLEPSVAIAEDGDKIKIRLMAGSFADAADAIQLCAVLIERKVDCRAVRSEGQRLAMR